MATAQKHTIKQGDTGPAIQATLLGANGTAQDLTTATVKFNLRKGAAVLIDHGACDIVDAPTGKVTYRWQAADTATPGTYFGEFEVTFADNETTITYPNDSNITVLIVPELK